MGLIKTVATMLIIIGMIMTLFVTLDPRVKPPIFEGDGVKFVAYRNAKVTLSGTTETYEQVIFLVKKEVELPDTEITINGTGFPIMSGIIYYFSAYYVYIPTNYTTAPYMTIGSLTFTNVYNKYAPKYRSVQEALWKTGVLLLITGIAIFSAGNIKLPKRKPKKQEKKEEEEVTIGEKEEEQEDIPEEEYEVVDDINLFLPPEK